MTRDGPRWPEITPCGRAAVLRDLPISPHISPQVHRQLGLLPAETSFTHYLSTRLLWDEARGDSRLHEMTRDCTRGLEIAREDSRLHEIT